MMALWLELIVLPLASFSTTMPNGNAHSVLGSSICLVSAQQPLHAQCSCTIVFLQVHWHGLRMSGGPLLCFFCIGYTLSCFGSQLLFKVCMLGRQPSSTKRKSRVDSLYMGKAFRVHAFHSCINTFLSSILQICQTFLRLHPDFVNLPIYFSLPSSVSLMKTCCTSSLHQIEETKDTISD